MSDPGRGGAALVVDDNASIRRLLARELDREGWNVTEAGDGRQAMASLDADRFELVITDLAMPYDGTTLVRWMLQDQPETGLVVMSGDLVLLPRDPLVEQAAILAKPFRYRQLQDAIGAALAARDERRQLLASLDVDAAIVCILTPADRVWIVNRAWRDFARDNGYGDGECGIGVSYVDVCETVGDAETQVHASRALEAIRAVRDGGAVGPFVYPCHAPWEERWFQMSVGSIRLGTLDLVRVRHARVQGPD